MRTSRPYGAGVCVSTVALVALVICQTARATERRVASASGALPDGGQIILYPNIQAAIDASTDGDVVILSPGTYGGDGNRDLNFHGKAVTLRGTAPHDANVVEETIIDCGGGEASPHRGLIFTSQEGPNTVVDGLTVVNGYAPRDEVIGGLTLAAGGAVRCSDANPSLRRCIFSDNLAEDYGGAIYTSGPGPSIADCTFRLNEAGAGGAIYVFGGTTSPTDCTFTENLSTTDGGAIYARNASTATDCVFSGNSAIGYGGALYQASAERCTITENSGECGGAISQGEANACTIAANSAVANGGAIHLDGYGANTEVVAASRLNANVAGSNGGGIYTYGYITSGGLPSTVSPMFVSSLIADNQAAVGGGGIYCTTYNLPSIINCTLSNNSATIAGGAIFCDDNTITEMVNCVLWGDSAAEGPELTVTQRGEGDPAWLETNRLDVQGGQGGMHADPNCTVAWAANNFEGDPLFVDPDGADDDPTTWEDNDYHLRIGSPCINAGISASYGQIDIDGQPRVMEGVVDVGADETPNLKYRPSLTDSEWTYCGAGAASGLLASLTVLAVGASRRRRGA